MGGSGGYWFVALWGRINGSRNTYPLITLRWHCGGKGSKEAKVPCKEGRRSGKKGKENNERLGAGTQADRKAGREADGKERVRRGAVWCS